MTEVSLLSHTPLSSSVSSCFVSISNSHFPPSAPSALPTDMHVSCQSDWIFFLSFFLYFSILHTGFSRAYSYLLHTAFWDGVMGDLSEQIIYIKGSSGMLTQSISCLCLCDTEGLNGNLSILVFPCIVSLCLVIFLFWFSFFSFRSPLLPFPS
jgi:hypothetical protein